MLEKIKNQENLIMIFFVVALIGVSALVIIRRNLIDVIYLGVLLYYFRRFLIIRKK